MKKSIIMLAVFAVTMSYAQRGSNFAFKFFNLYVGVDKFPQGTIVPPISLGTEFTFLNENVTLESAVTGSYAKSDFQGFNPKTFAPTNNTMSVYSMGVYFGFNYLLDQLISKGTDNPKFSASVGAGVGTGMAIMTSDVQGMEYTSSNYTNFSGNAKVRYFFSPRFGILGVVGFSNGGTSIGAGITLRSSR